MAGQVDLIAAVSVHDVNLAVPIAGGDENDVLSIRGPGWGCVVCLAVGQDGDVSAISVHDTDLPGISSLLLAHVGDGRYGADDDDGARGSRDEGWGEGGTHPLAGGCGRQAGWCGLPLNEFPAGKPGGHR